MWFDATINAMEEQLLRWIYKIVMPFQIFIYL
jgi:hypothetical protein